MKSRRYIKPFKSYIASSVFTAAILDFRRDGDVGIFDGSIESPYPKMGGGGRHRIGVSSLSVGEGRRGANLHLTAVYGTKRSRCSRVINSFFCVGFAQWHFRHYTVIKTANQNQKIEKNENENDFENDNTETKTKTKRKYLQKRRKNGNENTIPLTKRKRKRKYNQKRN